MSLIVRCDNSERSCYLRQDYSEHYVVGFQLPFIEAETGGVGCSSFGNIRWDGWWVYYGTTPENLFSWSKWYIIRLNVVREHFHDNCSENYSTRHVYICFQSVKHVDKKQASSLKSESSMEVIGLSLLVLIGVRVGLTYKYLSSFWNFLKSNWQ